MNHTQTKLTLNKRAAKKVSPSILIYFQLENADIDSACRDLALWVMSEFSKPRPFFIYILIFEEIKM